MRSGPLHARKLYPAMLLGVPLVLGRDARGRAFALRDNCPHRAMPLSFGRFDGSQIQCIYHGWKFEACSGQCREIPSLAADAGIRVDRIFVESFVCEERDGYVWVFLRDAQRARVSPETLPPVPELPVFGSRYRTFFHSVEFSSDFDQGVLGLLDPAHGPYVHQSWFWRSSGRQREKEKSFDPLPLGFRMRAHAPSSNSAAYKILGASGERTTTIDFVLPGIRVEIIRAGKKFFTNRTMVTPIRADLCRLDFSAAWNFFPWFPLTPAIFGWFARRFIAQDQGNFEKQSIGLRHDPKMMLVGDADRQARWFFALKDAWRDSLRTGAPLKHPLTAPVTLRWRS